MALPGSSAGRAGGFRSMPFAEVIAGALRAAINPTKLNSFPMANPLSTVHSSVEKGEILSVAIRRRLGRSVHPSPRGNTPPARSFGLSAENVLALRNAASYAENQRSDLILEPESGRGVHSYLTFLRANLVRGLLALFLHPAPSRAYVNKIYLSCGMKGYCHA